MEEALKKLLVKAKAEERTTQKTLLTKEIGNLIVKHFKSRENMRFVSDTTSGRTAKKSLAQHNQTDWEEWSPGKGEIKDSPVKKSVVADKVKDVEEPATLKDYVKMSNQEMVKHFGNIAKVKKFASNLGIEMDYELKPEDFLVDLKAKLIPLVAFEEEE